MIIEDLHHIIVELLVNSQAWARFGIFNLLFAVGTRNRRVVVHFRHLVEQFLEHETWVVMDLLELFIVSHIIMEDHLVRTCKHAYRDIRHKYAPTIFDYRRAHVMKVSDEDLEAHLC